MCDSALNQCANEGYDDFNRLSSHTVTAGSPGSFTYSYDRYGNRWQQTVTQGSGPQPSYSFNTSNNQIAGYSYDAAGNLTWDGVHSYTYDADGNVTAVDNGSTAQYFYDALNHKVRVQLPSETVESLFDPAGRITSNWTSPDFAIEGHIFWGDAQIAYRALGGTTFFVHRDWLNTDRVHTDPSGVNGAAFTSLPFGDGGAVNATVGYADWDFHRFGDLDYNLETDSYHAQFRQYSSTQGRWLSPDPYSGSYDAANPQSFNRYSYVLNNPLSFTDRTGQCGTPAPGDGALSEVISCIVDLFRGIKSVLSGLADDFGGGGDGGGSGFGAFGPIGGAGLAIPGGGPAQGGGGGGPHGGLSPTVGMPGSSGGSTAPNNGTVKCSGSARVLQGNSATIGHPGGFSGPSVGNFPVTANGAAVIPSQWGPSKAFLRPFINQIRAGSSPT